VETALSPSDLARKTAPCHSIAQRGLAIGLLYLDEVVRIVVRRVPLIAVCTFQRAPTNMSIAPYKYGLRTYGRALLGGEETMSDALNLSPIGHKPPSHL